MCVTHSSFFVFALLKVPNAAHSEKRAFVLFSQMLTSQDSMSLDFAWASYALEFFALFLYTMRTRWTVSKGMFSHCWRFRASSIPKQGAYFSSMLTLRDSYRLNVAWTTSCVASMSLFYTACDSPDTGERTKCTNSSFSHCRRSRTPSILKWESVLVRRVVFGVFFVFSRSMRLPWREERKCVQARPLRVPEGAQGLRALRIHLPESAAVDWGWGDLFERSCGSSRCLEARYHISNLYVQ